MGNFGDIQSLQIPPSGTWYDLFTGNVSTGMFYLQPGEFKLYTNKKVVLPLTDVKIPGSDNSFTFYPNPVIDKIHISIPSVNQAEIITPDGRIISKQSISKGIVNVSSLHQGAYVLKLTDQEGVVYTSRFIKE
jgi:hypothetical protein